MTTRNSLKRLIRSRMKRTGESYSTARLNITSGRELDDSSATLTQPADQLCVVLAQPAQRVGDLDSDLKLLFAAQSCPACDVLVLPELIGSGTNPMRYEAVVCELAVRLKCFVVGGSCYVPTDHALVNSGVVANHHGEIVSRYEKVRPYGSEIGTGIGAGNKAGRFKVQGREISVLICSDLWFSDSFAGLTDAPDAILIPSFSITQRDDPKKARDLWQHMLIARAYEYAAYVGVSDWAHPCRFDGLPAAGVAGFANPRPSEEGFYADNNGEQFKAYELDFARLDEFKANRDNRGFLWKPSSVSTGGAG